MLKIQEKQNLEDCKIKVWNFEIQFRESIDKFGNKIPNAKQFTVQKITRSWIF